MAIRDSQRDALDHGPGGDEPLDGARTDWAGAGSRAGSGRRVAAALSAELRAELDAGRGFLWLPVLLGIGIAIYFGLPREPALVATLLLAGLAGGLAWLLRSRPGGAPVAVALALVVLGFALAKARTEWVAAPSVASENAVRVSGWVAERQQYGANGARIVLRVAAIEEAGPQHTPRFVRFTLRSRAGEVAHGDAVAGLVRLRPPQGPVLPGGHDFARVNYFRQIGGTGFAYGALEPAALGPPPLAIRLMGPVEDLRLAIARRLQAAMPGENGRIATALVTGDQGGISDDTQDVMRASGLAHIMSISGLHMALVGGTAFWLVRALLALSSTLALRFPIKKWAAAAALAIATLYLGISGAEVPAQRSWIMLAIMLTAILVGRRAISLRNVALAALAVLLLSPESLLSASFQMSFAATVALVAGYEALAARRRRRATEGETRRSGRIAAYATGIVLTSLIAGLATTPYAAYHFQRIAPLSLIANVAAAPLVSIAIMPGALAGVLLMPFGLHDPPLAAMGWGLDGMIAIGRVVGGWSAAADGVPMAPSAALLLCSVGLLWLALWRRRWRLAGLGPVAAAIMVAAAAPRPDILINEAGTAVAVRGPDGDYRILGGSGARYEVDTWLRADADLRIAGDDSLAAGTDCDELGCTATIGEGNARVALALDARALAEDCRRARIVVAAATIPAGCGAALAVGEADLRRHGAHAVHLAPGGASIERVEYAYPAVRRPWMAPIPE